MVDDVVLCVYPALLGRGNRLFSDEGASIGLALVDTKATPSGVLMNTYRLVGPLQG